jgi:glycosyltransferase involved in cell wall biosynthesis
MIDAGPEVSVVIPTRNRAPFLGLAIKAALQQRDVELELIVVDDGSTDGTASVLDRTRDSRMVSIRNQRPRGLAAARNEGIARARGDWIAFLDDDDIWAPDKLHIQTELAKRCGARWAYSAAVEVAATYVPLVTVPAPPAATLLSALRTSNVIPAGGSNVLVCRETARLVGGFDIRLPHIADWDFWIRLAETAMPAVSQDISVGYVRHSQSMSRLDPAPWREFRLMAAKHTFRPGQRRTLDLTTTRWRAYQLRQRGRRLSAARTYLGAAARNASPQMALRAGGIILGEAVMRTRTPRSAPAPTVDWLGPYMRSTVA